MRTGSHVASYYVVWWCYDAVDPFIVNKEAVERTVFVAGILLNLIGYIT